MHFNQPKMQVTAPSAEVACQVVRELVQSEYAFKDPVNAFCEALYLQDTGTLVKILNETWFGIPESNSHREIDGFNECCMLLEDIPK
jgi:hypothetical protein